MAVAVAAVAAAAAKRKKKKGGLLCKVVGLVGACCRGYLSLPLLRTATLAGPSWAEAGASLCARSCS